MTAPVAIPPGQEPLLRQMLCDGCRLPPGWHFEGAAVERTRVRVRYTGRGGADVVLSLEHADHARTPARRAPPFGILVERADGGAALDPLLDAVAASVSEHGHRWRWVAAAGDEVDVELAALLAGAKPALRLTVAPDDADAIAERYRAAGAAVTTLGRTVELRGDAVAVVYAARSAGAADELRAVESAFFDEQGRVADRPTSDAFHRRIGALLGYPACCTEAFCEIARPIDGVDDAFRAARAAWTARPLARLNDLLRPQRLSLISFSPCSFACPAAAATANRIADAVARASAEALRRIDAELSRPLLVATSGLRAHVDLAGQRVRAATALPRSPDAAATRGDAAAAMQFAGADVDARGRAHSTSGEEAVVVDFRGG